ncbi:MAG: hypothetical protein IKG93_00760 [Clostridiales bacterium]|nr:hypothetical protein [Clostridiales bacterium]
MDDRNIFEENVMIPDIVNAKVDQALLDLPDHGTIREVSPKKNNNGKTVTRMLAITAAASVLLLSCAVYRAVRYGKEKADAGFLISESTDHPNEIKCETYTIMVAGQGLRYDNSIPLENLTSALKSMGSSYYDFFFECEFPLSVVGDNVESVEYSFKNAEVAIAHNGTSPDNITGEKINLDDRYLSDWPDEPHRYYIGDSIFDIGMVDFYQAYKEMAPSGYGEDYKKYLCVLTEDRQDVYEHVDLELDDEHYFPYTCDVLTALCKDIVVTVKVNFKDGSSEVTDIGIKGAKVPYSYEDEDGTVYNEITDGFACYIKGSSEEPGEVHLRSYKEEGIDREPFTDEELGKDPEVDPEVLQEQERLKKIVEEKNVLNDPNLPVIPYTFENGNGGLGRGSWENGWVYVFFGLPFIADGEDVDHVEFRSLSENLCFDVDFRVGDEEYRIKGTESSIGDDVNEAAYAKDPEHPEKGEMVHHCYSSFSMQYPVQEMQNYEICVELDVSGNEELKSKDTDLFTMKGYEDSDYFNTALKDAAIEMTVYFRDGTSVTKKIGFALILENEDGSRYSNRNLYAYIIE